MEGSEIEKILHKSAAQLPCEGSAIGERGPDFTLLDQNSQPVKLSDTYSNGAVMLVFYPRDFTVVCTRQLCNYRDSIATFRNLGIEILGISSNSQASHQSFAKQYEFPFRLLTDQDNRVARSYDCMSLWMLGRISRAIFIINQKGIILYRYVEPTVLTRRSVDEIISVCKDLRAHKLL